MLQLRNQVCAVLLLGARISLFKFGRADASGLPAQEVKQLPTIAGVLETRENPTVSSAIRQVSDVTR